MIPQNIFKTFHSEARDFSDELNHLLEKNFNDFSALEDLHQIIQSDKFKKGSDQGSQIHKCIYTNFDEGIRSTLVYQYRQLCFQWLSWLQNSFSISEWAIQRFPSVRIHFPQNVSVFEFHMDSSYSHPMAEINHFLSLTNSFNTSALQVEQNLGCGNFLPLNLESNQSAYLNTSIFKHGDLINKEGYTRVSIDFRAIPVSVLQASKSLKSLSKGKAFTVDDYFIHSDQLFDS